MRQPVKKRPKQKDSNVTSKHRYSDFLAPKYWLVWLNIAGIYAMAWFPLWARPFLARVLSSLLYWCVPSRRHIAQTNIRLCFPDKTAQQQEQMVKDTFFSNTLTFFETAHAWCRPIISVKYELIGLEHVQAAQQEGHGVLMLSGHFAPVDIGGCYLGEQQDLALVYRKHDNPLFNYFMTRSREKYAKNTIARRDMKGQLRELQKGGVVWYAPDQDYGRKASVFAPFFGIPTATITMTSKLAKAGRAKVIPISGYRTADHRGFVLVIEPPIDIPSGDDIADATTVNAWLESRIREHPEQYLWLHKRFKTRPANESSVY